MKTEYTHKTAQLCLEGSETTNKHLLRTPSASIHYTLREEGKVEFLLTENAELSHEEHAVIRIPKGSYVKYNQREFDPFFQTVTRVFD